MEGLVRGDGVFHARNRRLPRPAPRGDEERLRGVTPSIDRNGVRIDHDGVPLDDARACSLEEAPVDTIQPLDLAVLSSDQLGPVAAALSHGPAEAFGVFEVVGELGGVDEKLLRNASDVDARTAEI